MRTLSIQIVLLLALSMAYWSFVSCMTGVNEPWDGPTYWVWGYPVSLILAGISGLFFRSSGWLAGVTVTFAQLPIVWISGETSPLWVAGVLYACILAVPAMVLAALGSWYAGRDV